MAKQLTRVVILGLLLGLLLLVLQYVFKIPSESIRYWYPRIGVLVVLLSVVAFGYYHRRFYKKLNALVENYYEQDKEAFLRENLALLEKTKNKTQKAMASLNTSAAYAALERFKDAKTILEAVSDKDLPGDNRYVRIVNLTYTYFRLGENKKAYALIDEHREKLVQLQEKGLMLGRSIAINFIYEMILKANKAEAEKMLEELKAQEAVLLLEGDFLFLEKQIARK